MQCANSRWFYVIGVLCSITLTAADEPKIIIVGAGAAGIATASKLFANGFEDVTILEAEKRIGGRVHTVKFHDTWIDLGGQWVHGQTNNIVFEMVWPLGYLEIPERTERDQATVYYSDGGHIPDSIGRELIDFFEEASGTVDNSNDTNSSWGEYLERIVNKEFEKYPTVNETLASGFMKLFEGLALALDPSDDWHDVSLRGQREAWNCNGSTVVNWKEKGYGTFLDILMRKLPNPEEELPVLNNTLLNTKVVSVNYGSTEGKAVVETSDGTQYTADHVIMTPSLGVLKEKYATLFTPQLPESKVNPIRGLGFGSVAKIYLAYDEPWWPDDFLSGHLFLWDENDRMEYEKDPNTKWLVDIIGIYRLEHKPKFLYAWLSGASVRYMETLPEEQVLNQTCELLNKFLGKSYNITRPVGIKRSTWYSNENFRGTYSFRSMESERADVWAHQLAAPLLINDKPIVMFAGEATSSHYYGNVHGAVETGFREAARLIDMYKNSTK